MKYTFAFLLCIQFFGVQAQVVRIIMDKEVEQQIGDFNRTQANTSTIQVYRIQFGVTSDRREMETELSNFKNDFKIKTDWNQKGPYYYMKAGAYRTKLESFPDMQAIQARYSGAIYLVESVKKQFVLK